MATTLLPKTKIGIKKKIISADSLKPSSKPEKPIAIGGSKKSSTGEVLIAIKDFLLARYKRGVSSFIMKRRQRQEEKRKLREANIEKKKKKISLPSFKAPSPISNIFDSIGNFLLFLAGGVLFNKFFDLQKALEGMEKTLEAIGKGVEIFANVVGEITNFIDSSYKGYDKIKKQISNITGLSEEQVADFAGKLNKVINGTIIAALAILRGLPRLMRMRKPPTTHSQPPTSSTTLSRMTGGSNTGIDYRRGFTPSGQRLRSGPSISRFNNSMAKYISGKADPGDMLRLLRRGFFSPFAKFTLNSKALKILPYGIGSFIDFIIQYFVFKEPAGRAAFRSIGAGLLGFLGGLIGGPFALATGFGGAWLGDMAGGKLYDVMFGNQLSPEISGIDEYPEYDQITEVNNIYLQPIE